MSTNDTLRGRFLAWLNKDWNRNTFIDEEGDEVFIDDWVQGAWIGYSAALAEPVSGGVDEHAAFEAYALAKGWEPHILKRRADNPEAYDDWGVQPEWLAWQARAALNGGAVARLADTDRIYKLEQAVREFADFFSSDDLRHMELHDLADNVNSDACTCKPLESERGGE